MSFFAAADKIELRAPDGTVIFSTDNKMPALISSYSGTVEISQFDQGHFYIDLGAAPPNCEFLFPTYSIEIVSDRAYYVSTGSVEGLPTSALGTMFAYVDGRYPHDKDGYRYSYRIGWACVLNCNIISGRVVLVVDKVKDFDAVPAIGVRIKYKVHAGSFI